MRRSHRYILDVTGWEMRMPDGEMVIPQLVGADTYKYLGTEMTTGWASGRGQAAARSKVVHKCREMIGLIGRAPLASEAQIEKAIALRGGYGVCPQGRRSAHRLLEHTPRARACPQRPRPG